MTIDEIVYFVIMFVLIFQLVFLLKSFGSCVGKIPCQSGIEEGRGKMRNGVTVVERALASHCCGLGSTHLVEHLQILCSDKIHLCLENRGSLFFFLFFLVCPFYHIKLLEINTGNKIIFGI